MAVLTISTSTATCDACGCSQKLTVWEKEPSGWEKVTLSRRKGDGRELHFLLLCLLCQERALKALSVRVS